ncbi:MAG: DUF2203 domain-containing protein [Planctomycetales bacterium]|nr:DUF2203 domain-containing protein [Planctomycetales bacterium]
MTSTSINDTRLFSVEEANAMLPLVRAITTDVVTLARELVERGDRLDLLKSRREGSVQDVYGEELGEIEDELHNDAARLRGYVNELADLGVELKSAGMGLVDFPTVVDEQPAFLCWQLGEGEVSHWHRRDGSYDDRRPLSANLHVGSSAISNFAAEN